jgi:rubrerythrin
MDNDTLYDIFKMAIESEYAASEFYQKAAKNTTNVEAKRLFENFAVTELNHKNQLEELYITLKK